MITWQGFLAIGLLSLIGACLSASEIYIYYSRKRTAEYVPLYREYLEKHSKNVLPIAEISARVIDIDKRLSVLSEHLRGIHSRLTLPDTVINLGKLDLGQFDPPPVPEKEP